MKNNPAIPGILAVLFSTLVHSCTSTNKTDTQPMANGALLDTVIKILPKGESNSNSVKIRRRIEDDLGLRSIEDGYRNLQIRVWIIYPGDTNKLVIIAKTKDGEWIGDFFQYEATYDEKGEQASYRKKGSFNPNAGGKIHWKNIADSLLKLDVTTLPDYTLLKGYEINADEQMVTVEIAEENRYRIYSYPGPESRQGRYPEAQKITSIKNFVTSLFN